MNGPLAAIRHDLRLVADQARWAYTQGWWPATTERGIDLSRPEHVRLAGPAYDPAIGDARARHAWAAAVDAVAYTDRVLAVILRYHGVTRQAVLHLPAPDLNPVHEPVTLRRVTLHAMWRVDQLAHLGVRSRHFDQPRRRLDAAARALSAALDHGPADGIAHGEKPCKTCRIRPQAERARPDGTRRPSKGRECDTCAIWRTRNGHPRPTSLDEGPVKRARAAQARRHARGEGWGAA